MTELDFIGIHSYLNLGIVDQSMQLQGLQDGAREFERLGTLSDLLECTPVSRERILHRDSQSACLGEASSRGMLELFHTVFLVGDHQL